MKNIAKIVILTLWSALLLGMALSPAQAVAPANDDFARARLITGSEGRVTTSNEDATTEPGESFQPCCGEANYSNFTASVWFRWRATLPGILTVTTFGSNFDTGLAVFSGTSLSSLSLKVTNNNATNTNQSRVAFWITPGEIYAIRVSGRNGQTGNIVLNWELTASPTNDTFARAYVLTGSTGQVYSTSVAATTEPGESFQPSGSAANYDDFTASVWFRYTTPVSDEVTFTTYRSDFDTGIAVFTGSSVDSLNLVAANDNAGGTSQSSVTVDAEAGRIYHIRVSGPDEDWGTVVLNYNGPGPATYSVSGRITRTNAAGLPVGLFGARVLLSNGRSTLTDPEGYYFFTGLPAGNYTISATATGYTTTPQFSNPVSVSANVTARNFNSLTATSPTPGSFTVSGRITDSAGRVLAGVTVGRTGGTAVTTDATGNYRIPGVASGNVTITPTKAGFYFNPTASIVTVRSSNVPNINFYAVPITTRSITGTLEASNAALSEAVVQVAAHQVRLSFSKAIDSESAAALNHYTVTINGHNVAVESAAYKSGTVIVQLPLELLHVGDVVSITWDNLIDINQRGIVKGNTKLIAQ